MKANELEKALVEALGIEAKGKDFYTQARDGCRHALGKEIFAHLVQEEDYHAARIQEVHEVLQKGKSWPQRQVIARPPAEAGKLFDRLVKEQKQLLQAQTGDIAALETAQTFELSNEKFYRDLAPKLRDRYAREFFEMLAREERGHFLLVTDSIAYLAAPEEWFADKEKAHWDGA